MLFTTTCDYCGRTRQQRRELETDAAGKLCCDDCYDEETGKGHALTRVALSVEQSAAIWRVLRLRAAASSDAAHAALVDDTHAADVRFLESLKALRESLDIMRALEPGLPAKLDGTRVKWTAREMGALKSSLEELGRDRYWLGPEGAEGYPVGAGA